MARRGYFEKQGGEFRLRIVADGYNADNENVPPNKVIIDSKDLRTLSVYRSGTFIASTQAAANGVWIATWSLPYIPLCTFYFGYVGSGRQWWRNSILVSNEAQMRVSRSGIYVDLKNNLPTGQFPLHIRWAAYRLPVVE